MRKTRFEPKDNIGMTTQDYKEAMIAQGRENEVRAIEQRFNVLREGTHRKYLLEIDPERINIARKKRNEPINRYVRNKKK